MARKRMIDPDIWQDEKLAQLDFAGRLFFIGLITQANDFGKLRGNPKILKSMIFPYEDNHIKIEKYLEDLSKLGIIVIYQASNENFIKIKNWTRYQKVEHPSKDNIPEPSGEPRDDFAMVSGNLPAQGKISKDKLSKGANAPLSEEEFISTLKNNPAYTHIDVDTELAKMDAWLLTHKGRQKTRGFVVNWLNKIDKPMGVAQPQSRRP